MPKPIITSSRRRKGKNSPHHVLTVISALVLCLLVSLYLTLRRKASGIDTSFVAADGTAATTEVAAPTGTSTTMVATPTTTSQTAQPIAEATLATSAQSASIEQPVANTETETEVKEAVKRPQHFRGEAEQLLAMAMSVELGTQIPPLPLPTISADSTDEEIEAAVEMDNRLKRDLAAAMTNDIVVYDTDDAKMVETKEAVAEAKAQLAEILKSGGSITDAIKEYEAHINEGAKIRSEVLVKITPEVDAIEDDEKALEYVEAVNEALKKEDIPPIKPEEVGFEETE